jgi:hypothetical protein
MRLMLLDFVVVLAIVAPVLIAMILFVIMTGVVTDFFFFAGSDIRDSFAGISVRSALGGSLLTVASVSALPSMAHLVMSMMFGLSKIAGPIIKPPTQFLLLRFHESEKGVLTQIALGLGFFTKLVQELLK